MKTLNKFLAAGLLVASLNTGCKDVMKEMNSNPETVSSTNMEYLFLGATSAYFDQQARGTLTEKYDLMAKMQYIGTYGSYSSLNDESSGSFKTVGSWSYYYSQLFSTTGNALQTVLDQISYMTEEEQAQHADIRAITTIILAFQQWRVVEQYGAIVYSEAFKAITEGITYPKYELGKDIYSSIDSTLKAAVTTLSETPVDNTTEVGNNDYFYGWLNTVYSSGGSANSALGNYTTQRERWKKFANVYRLEMAWKLKRYDPTHYATVKSEVLAVSNGLMESASDGLYFHYPGDYDENPDDVNVISTSYAISENFLNTLRAFDDPRIPQYARTNSLGSQNSTTYRLMEQYYPDSLKKYPFLCEDVNGNDPAYYVGMTMNPLYQSKALLPIGEETELQPNFPSAKLHSFTELPYPAGYAYPDEIPVYNEYTGENDMYMPEGETFTITVQLCSPCQGRYFVKAGGKSGANLTSSVGTTVNALTYDGDGGVYDGIYLRRPIFTYASQCFMLAYLSLEDGTTFGSKSADEWFRAGITASLEETRDDALRAKIQIATNSSFPVIESINPDGLYTYTDAQIAEYTAAQELSMENVIGQAWIHHYTMPEMSYQWRKITGYPSYKVHTTPEAAAAETVAYLEQTYSSNADGTLLYMPRLYQLASTITTNETAWNEIEDALLADPMYTSTYSIGTYAIMGNTSGRIFWDLLDY